MRARAERLGPGRLVLGGLLLLAVGACGGEERGSARFEIYHLETAIGPPGDEGELRCGPPRAVCPGVVAQPPPHEVRYDVLAPPGVSDDGIDRSSARAESHVVSVALTSAGRDDFARLTREVARFGGRDQGWHHLAVVIGDEIVAFPEVDFDAYPDGFPDAPAVQITAIDGADARSLARRLRGG